MPDPPHTYLPTPLPTYPTNTPAYQCVSVSAALWAIWGPSFARARAAHARQSYTEITDEISNKDSL